MLNKYIYVWIYILRFAFFMERDHMDGKFVYDFCADICTIVFLFCIICCTLGRFVGCGNNVHIQLITLFVVLFYDKLPLEFMI